MEPPIVIVAGSADPARSATYEPAMRDFAAARRAAEELGEQLAKSGCKILVFSNNYIESDVVKGFARVGSAVEKSIIVRAPLGSSGAEFAEYAVRSDLFDLQPDPRPEWEVSFYRALREADGVLLIGGGDSVINLGHLALAFRLPLVTLAAFGGAAEKVWGAIVPERDLPSKSGYDVMARQPWTSESAPACVASLLEQCRKRETEETEHRLSEKARSRSVVLRSLVAWAFFIVAVGVLPFGWSARGLLFQVLLFFAGCIAGASGSTLRGLWTKDDLQAATVKTMVLGFAAGGIASLLYVVAQLSANPQLLGAPDVANVAAHPFPLLLFAVVIGFIAGFTSDAVYGKLATSDVVNLDAIPPGKKGG